MDSPTSMTRSEIAKDLHAWLSRVLSPSSYREKPLPSIPEIQEGYVAEMATPSSSQPPASFMAHWDQVFSYALLSLVFFDRLPESLLGEFCSASVDSTERVFVLGPQHNDLSAVRGVVAAGMIDTAKSYAPLVWVLDGELSAENYPETVELRLQLLVPRIGVSAPGLASAPARVLAQRWFAELSEYIEQRAGRHHPMLSGEFDALESMLSSPMSRAGRSPFPDSDFLRSHP